MFFYPNFRPTFSAVVEIRAYCATDSDRTSIKERKNGHLTGSLAGEIRPQRLRFHWMYV